MGIRVLGQSVQPAFYLYHTNSSLGWRVMHRVNYSVGEKKVARGVWRRVLDEAGNHIGYQPVAPAAARMDMDVRSQRSAASISAREMKVNAEEVSRTDGMSEVRRKERIAVGLAPEDRAERVHRKVQVFPRIGAARGDILRVWPRNAAEPSVAGV